jgi:hypothetical protein
VTLPGVSIGSQVVLQAKAWTTNYLSFEQARANGGDVAESMVWVQTTGGGLTPPSIISRWGFRSFLFPQCEPPRVPLFVERSSDSKVLVSWPVGVPPGVQVSEDSGATWRTLASGALAQDHWEFETPPTNGVRFFRLAQ